MCGCALPSWAVLGQITHGYHKTFSFSEFLLILHMFYSCYIVFIWILQHLVVQAVFQECRYLGTIFIDGAKLFENHSILISCLCNCCIKAIIALTVVLSYTIRPRVHIRIAAVRISGTLVLMPYCLNRIVNMLKEYHTCAQTSILSEFWINTLSEQWKHVDVVRGNHTYALI